MRAAVPRVAMMAKPISVSRRASAGRPFLSASLTERNTVPASRQLHAGAELGLGEGALEAGIEAHDLAGGFHLRAQDRVDVGEAGEREHRLLHRDMRRDRLVVEAGSRRSLAPAMTRAPILATGTPVALATNGTVREARGFTSST